MSARVGMSVGVGVRVVNSGGERSANDRIDKQKRTNQHVGKVRDNVEYSCGLNPHVSPRHFSLLQLFDIAFLWMSSRHQQQQQQQQQIASSIGGYLWSSLPTVLSGPTAPTPGTARERHMEGGYAHSTHAAITETRALANNPSISLQRSRSKFVRPERYYVGGGSSVCSSCSGPSQRRRPMVASNETRPYENFARRMESIAPNSMAPPARTTKIIISEKLLPALEQPQQQQEEAPPPGPCSRLRLFRQDVDLWDSFVRGVTYLVPNWCLSKIGRMSDPQVQRAWREKIVSAWKTRYVDHR